MKNCLVTKLKATVNNPNLPSIYNFDYSGVDGLKKLPWSNVIDENAELPWRDGSNVSDATFYLAASGDSTYLVMTTSSRIVSDLIEVKEGMVITTNLRDSATVPIIVCFDSNRNVLGPSSTYCLWKTTDYETVVDFTIPEGVKYIYILAYEITSSMTQYFIRGKVV